MLQGTVKMKWSKVFSPAKAVCLLLGITFLTSGLIINFIQFILYLLLRPISKAAFQKVNMYLSYSLFSQLVFLEMSWANVEVILHAEKKDYENHYSKEHAFIIMNHTYEIDWLIGWVLAEHNRVLGNTKIFAKKSLKNLPTLGFAWNLGGSIFLERNWEKDKLIFEKKLKELATYKDPIWLFLAAEGTRFTKEKHEASKIFARENGLPELHHHLTPRTKGFATCVPLVRHKVAAVYNVIVGIRPGDTEPTLNNILLGKPIKAEFYVDRIPMDQIPQDKAEISVWLHQLYKRKDDLLHRFLTTGSWFEKSSPKTHIAYHLQKGIYPALNVFFWGFLILVPLCVFIVHALISGNLAYCGTIVGILVSIAFLQEKLVEETKLTRASAYGITKDGKSSFKLESRT